MRREVRVHRAPDGRDGVQQVDGQRGYVVFRARRLARRVVGGDGVHDFLQDPKGQFGAAQLVGRWRIWSGSQIGGHTRHGTDWATVWAWAKHTNPSPSRSKTRSHR